MRAASCGEDKKNYSKRGLLSKICAVQHTAGTCCRHREREIKDVALHNCFLLNSKMFGSI